MRHLTFACACLAVLTTGCGSTPTLHESPDAAPAAPITVREAFSRAALLSPGRGTDRTVVPGKVPLILLNGAAILGVPITIDGAGPRTVTVSSRIVRRSNGAHGLYYPVITLVDEGFNATRTLKPTYEFSFSESKNTLSNEFKLPSGTRRIVIHTTDEYVRGSFVGTMSSGEDLTGASASAALGGALGAIVFLAANQDAPQIASNEYRFSEVGLIRIEAR